MQQIRKHETWISKDSEEGCPEEYDIFQELINSAGQNMNGGYIENEKKEPWLASIVPLAQMENHRCGDQFRYAEEHLVVPLSIEVVV